MTIQKPKNIKILATLGPSSLEEFTVQNMDSAGVDIFRINLSHTKAEDFLGIVKNVQSWTKKPLCADTEGAQIRTGKMSARGGSAFGGKNNSVVIKNDSVVNLVSENVLGDELNIPLYPVAPHKILQTGDILSIDFNSVSVQVIKIEKEKVFARVISGGTIGSNKGVNVDRLVDLPAFTKKDLKVFQIAKKIKLTHFALSFASRKEDVAKLRSFFPYPIFIVSKIESRFGLANLEEICKASDAILIDRGDLSREVPLSKIALAQKYILNVANNLNVPVYVATNLLESMIKNCEPTRAEINDITSTLMEGAQGLVLAAETAIGKYPVQSVRMVSGIKKEVEDWNRSGSKNYFNSIYEYNLIEPHGGVLVQNFLNSDKINSLKNYPKIDVDDRILSDVIQIAEGTYSPIRGFMNYKELISVLDHYKLPSGVVWTMPLLLQLTKANIKFGKKDMLAIRREKDKEIYAVMQVSDIKKIDVVDIAKKWFGTNDREHPGVDSFMKKGDHMVSGEVFLIKKPNFYLDSYSLSPKQTRQIFKDRGWQKIVGFHTRNVIHRGHEFIQQKALELTKADALFISPVVGQKKKTDFSAEAILKSYEVMMKNNYYDPYPALLGTFNTYSRYSGPREAVFTALCRKNLGCSHFVVGRDHTGVGNYYSPDASQKLFDKVGDIGIIPLMFNTVYYCQVCKKITDSCQHGEDKRLKISGTQVRQNILNNSDMPEYLLRKEIAEELKKMNKDPKSKLFED